MGYNDGKYTSIKEARKEASDEYFKYGYQKGLTETIADGNYKYIIYKCILVVILFSVFGVLIHYSLFSFLRKKRYINDIDTLLVPDMNNFDFSKVSDSELSDLMHHSIDKLGYIVEKKMLSYEETKK